MRRAILALLLALACSSAVAEWVKIAGNDYVASYVDTASIRKEGDKVKMTTVVDFKTVINNGGYARKSTRTQHEYDCKENRWRLLAYSYHSGNMGKGKVVYSENEPGTWEPVMPDSEAQARWKAACGKRQG